MRIDYRPASMTGARRWFLPAILGLNVVLQALMGWERWQRAGLAAAWPNLLFVLFFAAFTVWVAVAGVGGTGAVGRVELDDAGVRRTAWPRWQLPWASITQIRLAFRDRDGNSIVVYPNTGERVKLIRVGDEQLGAMRAYCAAHGHDFVTEVGRTPLVTSTRRSVQWRVIGVILAVVALPMVVMLAVMGVVLGSRHLGLLLAVGSVPILLVGVMLLVRLPSIRRVSADDAGLLIEDLDRRGLPRMRALRTWDQIGGLRFTPAKAGTRLVIGPPPDPAKGVLRVPVDCLVDAEAAAPLAELARRHGVPVEGA